MTFKGTGVQKGAKHAIFTCVSLYSSFPKQMMMKQRCSSQHESAGTLAFWVDFHADVT